MYQIQSTGYLHLRPRPRRLRTGLNSMSWQARARRPLLPTLLWKGCRVSMRGKVVILEEGSRGWEEEGGLFCLDVLWWKIIQ